MVFGKAMMVWTEAKGFHLATDLSSLFLAHRVLRILAGSLIHLARLEGEAGVGSEWSAEPGQPVSPDPAERSVSL